MVGAESSVGCSFKVTPATVKREIFADFQKRRCVKCSSRIGFQAFGNHDAWIQRTAHGVQYHEEVAILILHERREGCGLIPREHEAAVLIERD